MGAAPLTARAPGGGPTSVTKVDVMRDEYANADELSDE